MKVTVPLGRRTGVPTGAHRSAPVPLVPVADPGTTAPAYRFTAFAASSPRGARVEG